MRQQRGMTFIGLVLTIAAILFVVMVALKLAPAYMEYFTIKKTLKKISNDPDFAQMSKKDIMDDFSRASQVDDINSIRAQDLVVSKNTSGQNVVSVDYQKVVPIIANVSVLLDFNASSDNTSR